MYLVDDYGEPYVALFSVQYTPRYSDYPCRPHDACFKLKRDPKGREGVFIQPFSRDGISPVAHVSHEVEAALALGWPELSPNGYVVEFPGHYDGAKEIRELQCRTRRPDGTPDPHGHPRARGDGGDRRV